MTSVLSAKGIFWGASARLRAMVACLDLCPGLRSICPYHALCRPHLGASQAAVPIPAAKAAQAVPVSSDGKVDHLQDK